MKRYDFIQDLFKLTGDYQKSMKEYQSYMKNNKPTG